MLLSDDIEDWILNMENFVLNTCHGPSRNQKFNFDYNSWFLECFFNHFLILFAIDSVYLCF